MADDGKAFAELHYWGCLICANSDLSLIRLLQKGFACRNINRKEVPAQAGSCTHSKVSKHHHVKQLTATIAVMEE